MSDESDEKPGEIGRISPKKVAVSLTPLEQEALRKQKEQYDSGGLVSDFGSLVAQSAHEAQQASGAEAAPEISNAGEGRVAEGRSAEMGLAEGVPAPQPSKWPALIVLFVSFAAAMVIVVILLPKVFGPKPAVEEVVPSKPDYLSHIEVTKSKAASVDLSDALGVLHLGEQPYALNTVDALFFPEKSLVELTFYKNENSAIALLKLTLDFKETSNAGEESLASRYASAESLRRYEIEGDIAGSSFKFKKEYSRRLAKFSEVSHLAGKLEPGEKIQGAFKDSRFDSDSGKTISWDLNFECVMIEGGT